MAQVFAKFHGAAALLPFLEDNTVDSKIRCQIAVTIATLCQNNIVVQAQLYEQNILERLVAVYQRVSDVQLCAKTHYAVSCLIRGHPALEESFCQQFMAALFAKALQSPALAGKVFFLSTALLASDSATHGRVDRLCSVVLRHILDNLSQYSTIGDSIDMIDNLLVFLRTALHSEQGFAMILEHHDEVESFLVMLLTKTPESARLIEEVSSAMRNFDCRYPCTQPSTTTSQHNGLNTAEATSNSSDGPAVLLLEPPALEAASRIP